MRLRWAWSRDNGWRTTAHFNPGETGRWTSTTRVAIVTGSARGIGRAIADKMAAYGATVVITDLRIDDVSAARHPTYGRFILKLRSMSPKSMLLRRESAERLARRSLRDARPDRHPSQQRRDNRRSRMGEPRSLQRRRLGPDIRRQREGSRQDVRRGRRVHETSQVRQDRQHRIRGRTTGRSGQSALQRLESGCDKSDPGLCLGTCAAQHQRKRNLPRDRCGRTCTTGSSPAPRILDDSLADLTTRELFDRSIRDRMPLGREQTPEDIGNLSVFLASDSVFEHHWPGDQRQRRHPDELTQALPIRSTNRPLVTESQRLSVRDAVSAEWSALCACDTPFLSMRLYGAPIEPRYIREPHRHAQ